MSLLATVVLLALSALFSGLTLGLMSLSAFELKRKMELGDERARIVFPIRRKGSQLLVSLLIGNVLVNAALTVMLNSFLVGVIAVVLSTILITLFGEIIPQAVLNKHGLSIGARLAPLIKIILAVMYPIAYPLGRLLDYALGGELPTTYSKGELIKIFEEHEKSPDSEIEADELRIVENALSFGDKHIEEVMTPKKVVVALEQEVVVTQDLLDELHDSGNSRFPVYREDLNNVVGILYLRDMVKEGVLNGRTTKSLMDKNVHFVNQDRELDHVLNSILKTKNHLFVVVDDTQQTVGVVTIEDILEEIIGREIVDEFDKFTDTRLQTPS